jgi:hypothetical protein
MAFVRQRKTKRKPLYPPRGIRAMSGLLDDIGSFIKGSITSPLKAIQSNIEATNLLLKGDFSGANEAGKQGLQQIADGIQSSLEPLVLIDQEVKKIVPEEYRQFAVGPAEVAKLLVTEPEEGVKEVYESIRFVSAKPIYELSGKLFGYDNAAYLMPFDVKASDIGIKEGTPEAAEFYEKSMDANNVVFTVVGTIYPAVGIAWAAYLAAKTKEEQDAAKERLDIALIQAQKEMSLIDQQKRAAIAQEQGKLDAIAAELARLEAQKQANNAAVEASIADNENITSPSSKKAVLTIGALGALAAIALTQGG